MIYLLLGISIGYVITSMITLIKEYILKERMWKNIKRYLNEDGVLGQPIVWNNATHDTQVHHRFLDVHDMVQVHLRETNKSYAKYHLSNIQLLKGVQRLIEHMNVQDRILMCKYIENRSIIDLMEKEELFCRGMKE